MLIYTSSVRRRILTLLDVWVTMVAIKSSVEWLYDVKWRETGLNAFPWLMSVKWALNLSLNVLPVWPTYWRPHFLQLKTYTTLLVLQFKRPWIGIDCFVVQTVMWSVGVMYLQVVHGDWHGLDPVLSCGLLAHLSRRLRGELLVYQ